MPILLLLNIFALLSARRLTLKFASTENQVYRYLVFALIFYVQIILIQLFWGIIGKLYLGNILITSFLIFCLSLLFCPPASPTVKLFCLPREIKSNKIIIFCFALLVGFALAKIVMNLVNPPFGWDNLNYHFTFPVEWIKQAHLQNPITINDDLGPTYYPINGSLIYLWFIFPLKNVFIADLGQIPFFIVSFFALYGICRKLNINQEYSLYAACLFTITPNYFKQMEIAYVDVMVSAWFLASCYFLLSFYYQNKLRDVAFFSLSLGMLVGTKTIAILYGGLLYIVFFTILFRSYISLKPKKIIVYLMFSILLIIATGGFGYIRNFIQTGNPLYPMELQLAGRTIFKGVYDKTAYTSHVDNKDYAITKMLFHEGIGAGFLIFVIPGLAALIFNVVRKKVTAERFFIAVIPITLYFMWRYMIPLANLRYLYAAIALGFGAAFVIVPERKPYIPIVRILVILCFLAACAELSSGIELVASLLLSIVVFFSFKRAYSVLVSMRIKMRLICSVLLLGSVYLLNTDYKRNEYKRYIARIDYSGFWLEGTNAWVWLNENTRGDNIAYVGRPVPFPLYGTNFKNNVYYVSVNEVDPAMVHYFSNSRYKWGSDFIELHRNLEAEGNYRQHANYALWLANLERRKTDYLFVYSLHQTKETVFPIEDVWAKGHPEKFSLSFSNDTIHIYKLTS